MSKQATPYELLGGAEVLRRVVARFYAPMDAEPEFHAVRKLHPAELAHSTEKLYMFLSGYLGGPPLYQERIGNPMLLVAGPLAGVLLLSFNAWLSSRKVLRASPALTLREAG